MFDLGWSEMAIIMLVAIIVIGPKDLPRVARSIGKWTGKARSMARDFQRSLDDMAREADLDDIKKTVQKASPGNLKSTITNALEDGMDLDDKKAVSGGIKSGSASSGSSNHDIGGSDAAMKAAIGGKKAPDSGPDGDTDSKLSKDKKTPADGQAPTDGQI